MISSVSRVSFGDKLGAHQALIEDPGKFTKQQSASQPAMQPQASADAPKKHSALKIIGGIIGAVVIVGAGLFGLSKCVKVNPDTTNIFRKGVNKLVEAGEWIGNKVGGLFGKKGAKDAADEVADAASGAVSEAGETIAEGAASILA